jgi:transcription termination factor Rho
MSSHGRMVDVFAPVGKGQRGVIVGPAGSGKSHLVASMAAAVAQNAPDAHLMVVLVDEQPEAITDMQRGAKGEVITSTFDRSADDHTTIAELAIERAKRLVELGHDVVVFLDSVTRLARAYQQSIGGSPSRGGSDSAWVYPTKKLFGAARNVEGGGSLTIIGTLATRHRHEPRRRCGQRNRWDRDDGGSPESGCGSLEAVPRHRCSSLWHQERRPATLSR